MILIDRFRLWRIERKWKKTGRKEMFSWVYRYLRLHRELLEDRIYKEMYDYHRNTLIAYAKRDTKDKTLTEEQLGEMIDVFSTIVNKSNPARVNSYKPLVDELYETWDDEPSGIHEIRI